MAVVLPLKMVAFQSLLLLLAIAVEAYVLRERLKLTQKQSVHYATVINFLSTAIGWLLFLNIQSITPEALELQLINCIFFNRWQQGFALWVFLAALVTFFVSFFVKLIGLIQFRIFIGDREVKEPETSLKTVKFGTRRVRRGTVSSSSEGTAVLIANALSYSAVSLALAILLLTQGTSVLPIQ